MHNSNRQFPHGNPVLIPPTGNMPGTFYVRSKDTSQLVWQSHKIPSSQESVRIDVWHGKFIGHARNWAVLPEGNYAISWQEENDVQPVPQGFLAISSTTIFDEPTDSWAQWPVEQTAWQMDGQWQIDADGARPFAGPSHIFQAGAMHGKLNAKVQASHNTSLPTSWGLIIRHYSATHYLKLLCLLSTDCLDISLLRYYQNSEGNTDSTRLAGGTVPHNPGHIYTCTWHFNGQQHDILLDDTLICTAQDGNMGGVDIVGLWADSPSVTIIQTTLTTTQATAACVIENDNYIAEIRPGNVRHIRFKTRGIVLPDICWDSGIQFGHIGSSEIKFTQGARLHETACGSVGRAVEWHGPMPKSVEQSEDVRLWFYSEFGGPPEGGKLSVYPLLVDVPYGTKDGPAGVGDTSWRWLAQVVAPWGGPSGTPGTGPIADIDYDTSIPGVGYMMGGHEPPPQWLNIDITDIAQAWSSGTLDNKGMLVNMHHGANLSAQAATATFVLKFGKHVPQIWCIDGQTGKPAAVPLPPGSDTLHVSLPGGTGKLFCMTKPPLIINR